MENPDHPREHPGPAMQAMAVEFIPGGAKLRKNVRAVSHELDWVVGTSPDEAAARDLSDPTGLGWTRWAEGLIDGNGADRTPHDGPVLDDGGAEDGWVKATGGAYITHCRRAAPGNGMASADTDIEAIAQALSGPTGPVTVFTDSVTAIGWLTDDYPGPVPETAAGLGSTKRELRIGWIKGHAGFPGNRGCRYPG